MCETASPTSGLVFYVVPAAPLSNRRIAREADDPRQAMTVAARAPNVVERNPDQRVGISSLHGEIEIDDGVAGVTRDDEPVMLRASAAPIVGQNHAVFIADRRALNCRTIASESS